jgi:hypothetical protein
MKVELVYNFCFWLSYRRNTRDDINVIYLFGSSIDPTLNIAAALVSDIWSI